MKVLIDEYPMSIEFSIRKKLPRFKYACPVRMEILRRQLKKTEAIWGQEVCHHVDDFVVEVIEKTKEGEIWHLGS